MLERRSVTLTGGLVRPLPSHLLLAEMIRVYDEVGDCPQCRGTGTIVVLACLAGHPYTPVKDCSACAGTGWADRIERTPRTALHPHPITL